jgi:hypothetical protein
VGGAAASVALVVLLVTLDRPNDHDFRPAAAAPPSAASTGPPTTPPTPPTAPLSTGSPAPDATAATDGGGAAPKLAEPPPTRPDPADPTPSPPTVVPFSITVTGGVVCAPDGLSYRLSAVATGTERLSAATLVWRSAASGVESKPMSRLASSARGTRAGLRFPRIEWWVEAVDPAGDTASSARRTVADPC